MTEAWYHIARQAEDEDGASLWMVARDESGYLCRLWRLSAFDRRKLEAWMRMTELHRAKGLPMSPPPDISDTSPTEARFLKIHEARAYLGTTWDHGLQSQAAEFFRRIDPVRFPGAQKQHQHGTLESADQDDLVRDPR